VRILIFLRAFAHLAQQSNTNIDTPALSYFDSLWTTPLNWAYSTVAQSNADNREITWPRGKVLGGAYLRLIP
jgi:choline dehydrogenase-like flavoprotein